MKWTGGCLCGQVRYRATRDPFRATHCHCGMCRRISGAAFLTTVAFPADAFSWEHAEPSRYRSSQGTERLFCANCGSTVGIFESAIPDWAQVTLGSLDRPQDVRPDDHVHTESQLHWLIIEDDLPRYPRFSPAGDIEES